MSHEVLIARRQSIFLQIHAETGLSIQYQPAPASTGQHRPSEGAAWIWKKNKTSGYQDLMGHLILTTSP